MELNKLLNIKYPIIGGGMANISDGKFAATISNAGGLGLIASSSNDVNWIREQINIARSLTDKPFGVNIMLMSPHAQDIAWLCIEEKVDVVTTGAGNPVPYIKYFNEAGIKIIPVIPSARLAKRVEEAGADAVIAEGLEAGGHIGTMTTLALIPQVVDAVNIPVIAAGGIGDNRGVNAVFALGASGVQVGTILLATKECPIHSNYKQLIIDANDTDTVVTGSNKAPVRVIKSKMALEYLRLENESASFEELEKLTLGSLAAAVEEGDLDKGSFMAGQISGLIKEVKTVKEVIESLFE